MTSGNTSQFTARLLYILFFQNERAQLLDGGLRKARDEKFGHCDETRGFAFVVTPLDSCTAHCVCVTASVAAENKSAFLVIKWFIMCPGLN